MCSFAIVKVTLFHFSKFFCAFYHTYHCFFVLSLYGSQVIGKGAAQLFLTFMVGMVISYLTYLIRLNQEAGCFFHRNVLFCLFFGLWKNFTGVFVPEGDI